MTINKKEYNRKWANENKDKRKEYRKRDYIKHGNERRKQQLLYYRSNRDMRLQYAKEYRNRNKERIKEYRTAHEKEYRLRKYNTTIEEVEQLIFKQNNCCAICGYSFNEKRIVIDHNHKLNNVRGLLCYRCNTVLGNVDDKMELLLSMINYLKLHT